MSLLTIRDGLKNAIQAVHPRFNVYSRIEDIEQIPAIVIQPQTSPDKPAAEYNTQDFSGDGAYWYLSVLIFVEAVDMASADKTLAELVSPDLELSIPRIIDARRNREIRGASIGVTIVRSLAHYGLRHTAANADCIGAEITLEVEEE